MSKINCLKCLNRTLDWYCSEAHHKGGFLKKIENKNIVPKWCEKRKIETLKNKGQNGSPPPVGRQRQGQTITDPPVYG